MSGRMEVMRNRDSAPLSKNESRNGEAIPRPWETFNDDLCRPADSPSPRIRS